ncbi:hypothetical protein MYX07_06410 [Patescibacteria group bacterium AH-259-L07]|nr:hypothetical protein [Patescibacteria group bacterium AH-259-L07]
MKNTLAKPGGAVDVCSGPAVLCLASGAVNTGSGGCSLGLILGFSISRFFITEKFYITIFSQIFISFGLILYFLGFYLTIFADYIKYTGKNLSSALFFA